MSKKPEIRTGDPRLPMLANSIASTIEHACEDLGLGIDEAVCIIVQVCADYARHEYGNEYLPKLASIITARREMPMPDQVQ